MATCPKCKQTIDDDSWYCEHCGEKLYACPKCHTIGKGEGRRCGRCGSLLVEASTIGQTPAAAPQQPVTPTPQPQQPQFQQPQSQQVQPQQVQPQPFVVPIQPHQGTITSPPYNTNPNVQYPPVSPAMPTATSMVCHAMQTRIQLIDGAIIGREQGNYVAQLGVFRYVSGIHAQLRLNGSQWLITDLGSRNGTRVNGIPCTPALPFNKGDIIRLANFYDFIVE